MSKAHPGFQAVQSKIAKQQGVSSERAGAILAASSRGASKAAKKANPRLHRVKGGNSIAGPMKAAGLTEGPKHNLAAKESFKSTDARPAGRADQDSALSAARTHNSSAKIEFTSGNQRNVNLSDKCQYERGMQRGRGRLG